MKKTFLAILLLAGIALSVSAQSVPPTKWCEADGAPCVTPPTKVIVPSGTITGKTVTITSGGGSGTVTSVAQTFTGGLISVGGSPVTTSGTLALTVAGTSGGIPYFSSGSTWASSAALTANALMIGGGAGAAPATTTTASGILTFLGTPSSANFLSAITNETGSGLVMGNDTPTIITPSFTTGFTIGGVAATGTIPRGNGTNFIASAFTMAAPGTSGNVLTSDGTNWTSAAPAGGSGITIGTTAITSGTAQRVLFESATNKVSEAAGFTFDGTSILTLGVAGASVGSVAFNNATSGTITLSPVTGALGAVTLSLPATTSTLAGLAIAQTFTANQAITATVTTGTGTSSGFSVAADSLTTGTGANFASSSVTSGSVVNIAATGTAAASNTKTALNISTSGTNGTSTQTTYGAQIANTSTGTSSTNVALFLAASGGSSNSALNYTVATRTGYFGGDDGRGMSINGGTLRYNFNFSNIWETAASFYLNAANADIGLKDTGRITWGAAVQSPDAFLRRSAAANLAFGAADAASPVAQTLSVQNVVAGTSNTAGATRTEIASLGTSTGAPGRYHIQAGAMISASGSAQQTAVDRGIFGATKVLTNNSATTIVNVTNASNTSAGGVLDYCVEVFDATDIQYECGMVTYGVSNKGGAFSGNTVTKFGNHQNATAGTLTVTFAISAANPGVLSVNANSSLTPSTNYPRITYSLRNNTQQAVSIQ